MKKEQKEWRLKNKEKIKETDRKWCFMNKYGITIEQYNEIYNKQEGKCAVCGQHQDSLKQKLAVDHDHKTGKVRGLLCNKCNRNLGSFNDDIIILARAIEYLKKL